MNGRAKETIIIFYEIIAAFISSRTERQTDRQTEKEKEREKELRVYI